MSGATFLVETSTALDGELAESVERYVIHEIEKRIIK